MTKIQQRAIAEKLWSVYSDAVGNKTFDGKPLPNFSELGTQQKGWLAVADIKVSIS